MKKIYFTGMIAVIIGFGCTSTGSHANYDCKNPNKAILSFRLGCGFFQANTGGPKKWCDCLEENFPVHSYFNESCEMEANQMMSILMHEQNRDDFQVKCGTPKNPR